MQFCSLDRIWAREVAHLLSALQIIFWNCLLTLYDSIGFQTPGTLKILQVIVYVSLNCCRRELTFLATIFQWKNVAMRWWNPFKRPRLKGRIECPSTHRVSLDDSAPTCSIPFAQCENIGDLWLSSLPVGQVGLALNNTGKDMAWMHDMVSGFGLLLEKRIWTQQPWQKIGGTWFNSNNTSDAYLDWFAGRRNWMGRWGSSNWWISCFGGIPCDSHLVAECSVGSDCGQERVPT